MPAAPAVNRAALPAPADPAPASRLHCAGCGRPPRACWCGCVRAVDNPTALLILQDPQEQHQAKGTAALLLRCLRRVECRVGERFEPPASLQGLALLYPETPGDLALLASLLDSPTCRLFGFLEVAIFRHGHYQFALWLL